MARKQTNTAEYFPHKVTHRRTIFKLETKYGNDGYAFFFKLLEMLGAAENHYLDLSDEGDWDFFVVKMRIEEATCNAILNDLLAWKKLDKELFEQSKIIWYEKFVQELVPLYQNRRREIPVKPHFYSSNDTQTPIPTPESTQSRVEYSRVENSIGKESKENVASSSNDPLEANQKKEDQQRAAHTGGAGPAYNRDAIIYPFDTPNFREWWGRWLEFKQTNEKVRPYAGVISEQSALMKLNKYDEQFSISLIQTSIERAWDGLAYASSDSDYQQYLKSKSDEPKPGYYSTNAGPRKGGINMRELAAMVKHSSTHNQ